MIIPSLNILILLWIILFNLGNFSNFLGSVVLHKVCFFCGEGFDCSVVILMTKKNKWGRFYFFYYPWTKRATSLLTSKKNRTVPIYFFWGRCYFT